MIQNYFSLIFNFKLWFWKFQNYNNINIIYIKTYIFIKFKFIIHFLFSSIKIIIKH